MALLEGGQVKRDLIYSEIACARIRALQAMYPDAHEALRNWGAWSRDRYQIGPRDAQPGIWDEAVVSKFGDFADESDTPAIVGDTKPAKAERADREEYDEKAGAELDERIHNSPDFPAYQRDILRIAYVSRETPEDQFPRHAGCSEDTFCERLEGCLWFVERNI